MINIYNIYIIINICVMYICIVYYFNIYTVQKYDRCGKDNCCSEACRGGEGGLSPPKKFQRQRNTTKSLKSGLKTRLGRFKNRKFSYPGYPNPRSLGPSGLGAYNRLFGPRFFLSSPPKKIPLHAPALARQKMIGYLIILGVKSEK